MGSPQVFSSLLACSSEPTGTESLGRLGICSRSAAHLEVGFGGAGFEGGDAVFEGGGLERYGGDVFAFALEAADLLREGVALGLEGLDLGDGGAACGVERGEVCEEGRVGAALPQFFFDQREVGTDKGEIEHILLILAGDRTKCVGVGPGSIYSGACGD